MRPALIIALLAAAALLTACGKRSVSCDGDGMIIIPDNAGKQDRDRWLSENADLAFKRVMKDTGNPQAVSGSLTKAPSCP